MLRNEHGLFKALERVLPTFEQPVTCHELMEIPEIKALAGDANRVSDYLGNMWRKGIIDRLPVTRSTRTGAARWAYQWRTSTERIAVTPVPPYSPSPSGTTLLSKPNVTITDNGSHIKIELPSLSITIQTK